MRLATPTRSAWVPVAALLAATSLSHPAWAQGWTVEKVSGKAWIRAGDAKGELVKAGMSVPASEVLVTSSTGRLMLHSAQADIVVAPDSTVRLGDAQQATTTVLQYAGRAEYQVDKRHTPHFAVETPLLSAVVKGTHFIVAIEKARSFVSVDEGLVAVSELRSGKTANIAVGQTAISQAGPVGGSFSLYGVGALPAVHFHKPRAPLTVSSPVTSLTPPGSPSATETANLAAAAPVSAAPLATGISVAAVTASSPVATGNTSASTGAVSGGAVGPGSGAASISSTSSPAAGGSSSSSGTSGDNSSAGISAGGGVTGNTGTGLGASTGSSSGSSTNTGASGSSTQSGANTGTGVQSARRLGAALVKGMGSVAAGRVAVSLIPAMVPLLATGLD